MAARISEEKLCALVLGEAGETEKRALEGILQKDAESLAARREFERAAGFAREALGPRGSDLALTEEQRRKVLEAMVAGGARTTGTPAQGFDIDIDVEAPGEVPGRDADNSDLFSLDNLQTLAREEPVAAPSRGSGEETSGLVDLRSLAQARDSNEEVEISELLNLGPGGSAGLAPVLAPEVVERRRNWMIGVGAGLLAVLVIGGLIYVIAREAGKPDPVDENEQAIAMLMEEIEKLKVSGASEDDLKKAEEALADEQAKKVAREGGEPEAAAKPKPAGTKEKKSGGGSGKAATAAPAAAPPSKPKGEGVAELDDLLGGGGSKPAKKPAATGGGGVADKLSKEQVQSGMKSVAGAVKACGKGAGGTVTIRATISPSGTVSSAKATGSYAGTPVGACAEKAVKRAKFPKARNKLDVSYPFKL